MAKSNLAHLHPTEQQALAEFVELLQKGFNGLVHLILLFGSKARGDYDLSSDLDVLVVVDSDDWRLHKQIRYLAADVSLKYELDLSPRIWSVLHLREMKEIKASLYQNIRRDGVSLLERELEGGNGLPS
ncbi:MAG: nucleotidyltransferase domain-containing protein [Chloroflexi bacterium]|nr:nucleotidyltransferase domain-containing protein [Chloroflexota bacterium]